MITHNRSLFLLLSLTLTHIHYTQVRWEGEVWVGLFLVWAPMCIIWDFLVFGFHHLPYSLISFSFQIVIEGGEYPRGRWRGIASIKLGEGGHVVIRERKFLWQWLVRLHVTFPSSVPCPGEAAKGSDVQLHWGLFDPTEHHIVSQSSPVSLIASARYSKSAFCVWLCPLSLWVWSLSWIFNFGDEG